ncbi:MAG TPA: FtsK/SpoIIIE domain-containing protein, partial [Actinomycetes bacterium]|nr:FtsK/SpoIIIE domain-containing protein [Actinomycetes bacterium]
MRLILTVVDPPGSASPVDVEVSAAARTPLSDLRAFLLESVGRRDGTLFCGGRMLAPDHAVGHPPLVDGAVVCVDRADAQETAGLLELHVLAGPDAGAVHRLVPGEHGIGRAVEARLRVADPGVSRLHAVLRVGLDGRGATTVHDVGSTNGTTVDGEPVGGGGRELLPGQLLRVGDTVMALEPPRTVPVSCRPDGAGHLELNRPPRHLPDAAPVVITMPSEPAEREPPRFPLLAVALPLLAGLVLVAVTRSPAYLLFMLLSPVMLLGTWFSDRSGGRRSGRRATAQHEAALTQAHDRVRQALREESAARHEASPAASALLLSAEGPRPRLWERRPEDADFLTVRLGLGAAASMTEVRTPASATRTETVEHPQLVDVPVTVSLVDAGVVGLAGPRPRLLAMARFLTAQIAGWHSPRHVELVVLCPEARSDWEWGRWLPHLRPTTVEGAPLRVGTDPAQVRARVDELVAVLDARRDQSRRGADRVHSGPTTVVVLDGAEELRRLPGVVRLLSEGPDAGIVLVCCDRDLVSLPAECRATVEVGGDAGTRLRVTTEHASYEGVVADGVDERWARRFARALAPLRDATPEDVRTGLPDSVQLLDLLDVDATDPAALEAAWRVNPRSTRVAVGVGVGGETCVLDLAGDGPHALVAGTTGSGKSELLQTLVAGLAVANRPDEMCFVLVDYKGGAAFRECARLPHTVGLVTDLDGHLTERALRSLGAELRRREQALADAGCADLAAYQAAAPPGSPLLPRFVLVVDEFATLAEELPDFVGGLVGIAQRGRSLGVHLVLATQRPSGVVSADIRANTGLRIALRVTDSTESTDVIDVPDAAEISRYTPGRAAVRTGTGTVRHLQTARVGGHTSAGSDAPAVRAVPWEAVGALPPARAAPTPDGPTDLSRLVAAAAAASESLGARPVASPWLPPLPVRLTTGDLPPIENGVPLGLLDLPDEQRRARLRFALDTGDHLLVVGAPRTGRSSLLRTLATTLANHHEPTDVHLYALEGGGGALGSLAGLPHCGAVVERDETARGNRLLTRLVEELEDRQRLLAAGGTGSAEEHRDAVPAADRLPWMVVLADGWEGLQSAYEAVQHGRPLDDLMRLVREGGAVGIRVVLTGDRSVLTSRIGGCFRDRLVLRLAEPADYGLAGISARRVPASMPPGRALVGPDATEAQLALLDGEPSGAGQVAAVRRTVDELRRAHVGSANGGRRMPLRVRPLPARVTVGDLPPAGARGGPGWALVGVGGDEAGPVGVDLVRDGPAFVIAGPPRSGRSTALATMG